MADLHAKNRLTAEMRPLYSYVVISSQLFSVAQSLVVARKRGDLNRVMAFWPRSSPPWNRENGQFDQTRSGTNDFKAVGGLPGEVDDPSRNKGTPIID